MVMEVFYSCLGPTQYSHYNMRYLGHKVLCDVCLSHTRVLSLEDMVELLAHTKPLLSSSNSDRLVQLCYRVIYMWFIQGYRHCHTVGCSSGRCSWSFVEQIQGRCVALIYLLQIHLINVWVRFSVFPYFH